MSLPGSLLLACAGVHLYAMIFHGVLHKRLRDGQQHAKFAFASFGLCIYSIGSALVVEASSEAFAAMAQRLQFTGGPIALVGFVALHHDLMGRKGGVVLRAAIAVAAAALVANLAGLLFDSAVPARIPSTGLPFAPVYREAAITPLGIAYLVSALLVSAACVVILFRASRRERYPRLILVLVLPLIAAIVHDVALRIVGFPSFYLFDPIAVLASVGVSFVLLRRFVHEGDELSRRTDELRKSYDDLQKVHEELFRTEQLAAIGELSAVIANEVQQPIELLREALAGLRTEYVTADQERHALDVLDQESDRLNRLVRDLLTYARPIAPQKTTVLLERVLKNVARHADASRGSQVKLRLEIVGAPSQLACDRDLLERAFADIVENALQAMPSGGTLTIRAIPQTMGGDSGVAISFHDTGEGMDTLVREKAREPFFTTRPTGTGLGLAIVDRIVRAHGGRLMFQSGVTGTTVTVVLPAYGEAVEALETS